MKKVTVLIPAYNESASLPRLVEQLDRLTAETDASRPADNPAEWAAPADYDWEYLIVNDGSTDSTLDTIRALRRDNPRVNVLNLSRNFGKENAMLAGMDYASGQAVVIMDADLQHPVDAIPRMLYWWRQGYDDVYGQRRRRGRESWLRKRLSLAYYALLQGTTSIEILQNVGDFRLLDRRVVDAIRSLRESQRYTKGLYCWVGYNKKGVLFEQDDRREGRSSFNLRRLLALAMDGVTCFTTAPLRLSTIFGFIVSVAALIYLVFVMVKTIVYGDPVQGFPTLLCVILFMGGVQLIALGVIGEYIGRIFNETKQRPPYIVESFNGDRDVKNFEG